MSKELAIEVHAATNPGTVRERNEDSFLLDEDEHLYGVFDGMGGHTSGEVASRMARDVVHEYVRTRRKARPPRELLMRALRRASGVIYDDALVKRERHGMGTTAVACLIEGGRQAFIAHVGDSRAYLLRDGRLRLLTRDHTVVSELLARGAITAADAVNHPYKSVLSRNLGGKPTADVDCTEMVLEPGDRLLLCSDGLNGFAVHDAIEQVLSGAEDTRRATADLIDLALRGGGGDNVTALVIEAGQAEMPRTTMVIRTTGAPAWWSQRERFLAHAAKRGVDNSPVGPGFAAEFCEAIYHDLEQGSGIHVWRCIENLARAVSEGNDKPASIRGLLQGFEAVIGDVIGELRQTQAELAAELEVAVMRTLVAAEVALLQTLATANRSLAAGIASEEPFHADTLDSDVERTIPFVSAARTEPPTPEVVEALDQALSWVLAESLGETAKQMMRAVHTQATSSNSGAIERTVEALSARGQTAADVNSAFRTLETARGAHLHALKRAEASRASRLAGFYLLAAGYQAFAKGLAVNVEERRSPVAEALRRVLEKTRTLRERVGRLETELSTLERMRAGTEVLRDPEKTIPDTGDGSEL